MNNVMIISFLLYLALLITIGLLAVFKNKQNHKQQEGSYHLPQVNWWITAISAQAADMSSWLFLGLPGLIYVKGLIGVWVAIGLIVGMWATWHFLAASLRSATEKYQATTLPGYFEKKYREMSGRIGSVSALIMALFFTLYIAAGIKGVQYILETTFAISPFWGGVLALCVTVSYTLVGGFVGAAWVDFFQGIFLLGAIVITTLFGFVSVGGFSSIYAAALEKNISLSFIDSHAGSLIQILLDPIAWGLGYFGMPHILAKFMGAKDAQNMYKSKYVGIIWLVIALSAAIVCGFVGLAFFPLPLTNPEKTLFTSLTMQLFPSFIAGLILCGILSATLSTISAQMLVFGNVVAEDLYKKIVNPRATAYQMLSIFRITIIGAAALGFIIAWTNAGSIFTLVEFAWGGLGASFGPLTLLSFYYDKINRHGAFYGIIAGCLGSVMWKLSGLTLAGYTVNEVLPGFLIGLLVIIIVSKLTEKIK